MLAFFELNKSDQAARQYLYTEIPLHYTWKDENKKWNKREKGADKIISRMYVVSPKDVQLFHLRLLLLHVRDVRYFEECRMFDGVTYNSFIEACHARGIASNDSEWHNCLDEAKEFHSAKQLRHLFGVILALNLPANALNLWNDFKNHLYEDFLREHSDQIPFIRGLLEIEDILLTHNVTCEALSLPQPTITDNVDEADQFDPAEEQRLFNDLYDQANNEQRSIIDNVVREVQFHDTGHNVFCLTAHAGCYNSQIECIEFACHGYCIQWYSIHITYWWPNIT